MRFTSLLHAIQSGFSRKKDTKTGRMYWDYIEEQLCDAMSGINNLAYYEKLLNISEVKRLFLGVECQIKQTILPLDKERLEHHFKVEFSAPGFGKHTYKGNVSQLRRTGYLKPFNRPYFDRAEIFKINKKNVMFAKMHNGHYYVVLVGKKRTETHINFDEHNTFELATAYAHRITI